MPFKDPDQNREYQRIWAQRKKLDPLFLEKKREVRTRYRKANPEKEAAYKRDYYAKHKDEVNKKNTIYKKMRYWADPVHREKVKLRKRNWKRRNQYGEYSILVDLMKELKNEIRSKRPKLKRSSLGNDTKFKIQKSEHNDSECNSISG